MSKKFERFKRAYKNAKYISVLNAYGNPSQEKIDAEIKCKNKMLEMGGYGYKILSAGSWFFSCGWLVVNQDTGVVELCVETVGNSYRFDY